MATRSRLRARATGDRGGIVLGWLTKLTVGLVLLGVVLFDIVALVQVRYRAADDATNAAREAAEAYKASHDVQKAYAAAVATVDASVVTVDAHTFRVLPTGAVQLRVRRTTSTLVVEKIGPIKKWGEATSAGAAPPAV
ncbi:MAG TPA: hypothetical protein VNA30_04710 [Mycobacteriales bacterium]|nr:hypothetical protein [Mycobacteriales bacterium]